MIVLHDLKGKISGQVLKNLEGKDIRLLASNINRAEGTQWQTIIKFRSTAQHFPAQYGFALCLHDAFQKEPFVISLTEAEARQKLKSWGHTASEAEALINSKMEVE